MKNWIIVSLMLHFGTLQCQESLFKIIEGSVAFVSEAPLEIIKASSVVLNGVMDIRQRSFAISMPVNSFQGFNSALQREHFNENYMESARFPKATFSGRIIEETDFSKPGTYTLRAKGKLMLHGVEQERILKIQIQSTSKGFSARAVFSVLLDDHQISIPRVVNQKIAEEIQIEVEAFFVKA
jgi:polyisoprenoid-binding protein YceI